MLSFRVQTNTDTAVDTANMKGRCIVPAGTFDTSTLCHAPSHAVPVRASGGVVNVPFSSLTDGAPVAGVDGSDIVGLEWAFTLDGGAGVPYAEDVTIDDVQFTGAGGAR